MAVTLSTLWRVGMSNQGDRRRLPLVPYCDDLQTLVQQLHNIQDSVHAPAAHGESLIPSCLCVLGHRYRDEPVGYHCAYSMTISLSKTWGLAAVSEHYSRQCYNSGDTTRGVIGLELGDAEILHVAHLARLRLTTEELGTVRRDLNRVLTYVSTLQELDLDGVPPTMHVAGAKLPLRQDRVGESLSTVDATDNGPEVQDGMFVVPRIMEGADNRG